MVCSLNEPEPATVLDLLTRQVLDQYSRMKQLPLARSMFAVLRSDNGLGTVFVASSRHVQTEGLTTYKTDNATMTGIVAIAIVVLMLAFVGVLVCKARVIREKEAIERVRLAEEELEPMNGGQLKDQLPSWVDGAVTGLAGQAKQTRADISNAKRGTGKGNSTPSSTGPVSGGARGW